MLNTTAFSLTGYKIVREMGTVRGVVVRSRSVIGSFGASIQTIFGGDITLYTELCEKARQDAYERMCRHASELGANAIIGVRYDATEVAQGVTEVLCYGTAVFVENATI
ncbi:MAG TPA: YbjQ family protein [Opitutaceae bacterium]|nr:YbjQ family protein [Opitutaceae bacterium]